MFDNFLDADVMNTQVYVDAGLERNRKFRYVLNRVADVLFYDNLARFEALLGIHGANRREDIADKQEAA